MKKTFLTAAFAFLAAAAATAQDAQKHMMKSPEERAQHHARMMGEKLKLSADQRAKVQQIDLKANQDMQVSMDAAHRDRDKMRAMMQQRDEQYKQVLTPQQFADYQQMKEERKAHMQHRMDGMRNGGPVPPTPADQQAPAVR